MQRALGLAALVGLASLAALAAAPAEAQGSSTTLSVSLTTDGLDAADTVDQGQTFTLTATVQNTGSASASSVSAALSLPSGLALDSGSTSQSLGTLASSGQSTVQWVIAVNAAGNYDGQVQVSVTASNAPTASEDLTDLEVLDPPLVRLFPADVGKTTGTAVSVGVVVRNLGDRSATNITVEASVPSPLSVTTAPATLGTLAGGAQSTFTFVLGGGTAAGSHDIDLTLASDNGGSDVGSFTLTLTVPASGGGGSGGSTGDGSSAPPITPTVTTAAGAATATASITGGSGATVRIDLGPADATLGTLALELDEAVNAGAVTVTIRTQPAAGAAAVPSGFGAVRFLEIDVPDGVRSGTLTFTVPAAQRGGAAPQAVVLLHHGGSAWEALPTTLGSDGVTYTATLAAFSPFAVALDQDPPTIVDLQPAEGAAVGARPVLGARVADNRGIDAARATLRLDGQAVQATLAAGMLRHTPPQPLAPGLHTVTIEVADASGLTATRTWSFTVQAGVLGAPQVTPAGPAPGEFVNRARPVLSARATDDGPVALLRAEVLLDGTPVLGAFVVGGEVAAMPPSDLADGSHDVVVRVTDAEGKTGEAAWSFVVDTVAPALQPSSPASGARVPEARPILRARASDAVAGLQAASMTVMLDGVAVPAALHGDTITHTPAADLAPGTHTVEVRIADRAGNEQVTRWSFQVATAGASGMPWSWVAGGGAVLLLAAVGAVAWRRRTASAPGAEPPQEPPSQR